MTFVELVDAGGQMMVRTDLIGRVLFQKGRENPVVYDLQGETLGRVVYFDAVELTKSRATTVQAQPGWWRVTAIESEPELVKEPIIAWQITDEGEVRPVTACSETNGQGEDDRFLILPPDGCPLDSDGSPLFLRDRSEEALLECLRGS